MCWLLCGCARTRRRRSVRGLVSSRCCDLPRGSMMGCCFHWYARYAVVRVSAEMSSCIDMSEYSHWQWWDWYSIQSVATHRRRYRRVHRRVPVGFWAIQLIELVRLLWRVDIYAIPVRVVLRELVVGGGTRDGHEAAITRDGVACARCMAWGRPCTIPVSAIHSYSTHSRQRALIESILESTISVTRAVVREE